MDKPISEIMSKNFTSVELDDSIEKVERVMDSQNSDYAVDIAPNKECFGIISYADIVHFYEKGSNPKLEKAWELCSHKTITVGLETTAREAAAILLKNKIHHNSGCHQ